MHTQVVILLIYDFWLESDTVDDIDVAICLNECNSVTFRSLVRYQEEMENSNRCADSIRPSCM